MKEFAELKEIISEKIEALQDKIEELQKELDTYKETLKKIDTILEKESFKTAAELYQVETKEIMEETDPSKILEPEINKEFEINSDEGIVLGKMEAGKDTISITLSENIKIPEDAPPFKTFFLGRILKQMEEEDLEDIKNGKINEDEFLSFEINKSPDNNIQKIIIKNYRTYNRMIKILNTISWTLRTVSKQK